MHLLFVHERLGSFGGAESNLFATASELRRRGHEVGLFTQQNTGRNEAAWNAVFREHVYRLGEDCIEAVSERFPFEAAYVHKWEDLPSMERLLDCGRPLVRMVHDHDIYCMRSYRYHPLTRNICHRPLGARCIFPCLAPLQARRGSFPPVRWASFFKKRRELELARRFPHTVVATRYMRDELLLNGFAPDSIEVHPYAPLPAEPLRSGFSERNLLVFAGQLIRGKGVDVMLRALAKVPTRFECIILGEGSHRAKCERLCAELGLSDRVSFQGFIPAAEIRAYYQEATAVLVPSVWPEPMGLVGLEAMQYGLPVVGFDVGGIREWLHDGETGFLVPCMDTDGFAAAIDTLLKDKNKARAMGERGLAYAERDYSFQPYIDGLENMFLRVIAEHSNPQPVCVPA